MVSQLKITSAFKEWNSVVEALGHGEQIIILRKGGIIEDEGYFYPKEKHFLLFPTQTHERKELLKKVYPNESVIDGSVLIKYWAETKWAGQIFSEAEIKALDPYHIWKEEVVLERFHRWNEDKVWCLVVRVYKFKNPIRIELIPDYAGCKSWINIIEEVPVRDSEPVIGDSEFEKNFNNISKICRFIPL